MELTQFIGGSFQDCAPGDRVPVINPANSHEIGQVPRGSPADIEGAVAAAARARAVWAALSVEDRYSGLQIVAGRIRELSESLTAALVAEGGLTLREAQAALQASLSALQYPVFTGVAAAGKVTAVLGPASSPVLPIVRSVSTALMAGDSVVVRPSAGAVLANLLLCQAWAVLPPGAVNVVAGDLVCAEALVSHPDVGSLAFSGSAQVAAALAATGKPMQASIGRLDAAVVRKDADLDLAVRAIAWSRLRHGGRTCLSSQRVFVDATVAADFTVRLHQYVGLLEVDDPARAETQLGPLGSLEAAKACENRVVKTMRSGGRLVLGGFRFRPAGLKGAWLQPTILADVPSSAPPMREVIGGPVLAIASYADDGELRARLADTPGPIGLSMFGADLDEMCAWASEVPASALWLNVPQSDYAAPAGQSGMRPVFRPAYASGVVPEFFELDPLRVWSAT